MHSPLFKLLTQKPPLSMAALGVVLIEPFYAKQQFANKLADISFSLLSSTSVKSLGRALTHKLTPISMVTEADRGPGSHGPELLSCKGTNCASSLLLLLLYRIEFGRLWAVVVAAELTGPQVELSV